MRRDLSKPVGALNPARLELFRERYREMPRGEVCVRLQQLLFIPHSFYSRTKPLPCCGSSTLRACCGLWHSIGVFM
jgi:hypothetical protein